MKMNHWLALNCETGEFGFFLQSCVWLVMGSHLLSYLPQYPPLPFSTVVSYRSYQSVLTVDTSILKSEEWQRGVNENIPRLALLSLACSTDFSRPNKYPWCLPDLHPVLCPCFLSKFLDKVSFSYAHQSFTPTTYVLCAMVILNRWHLDLNGLP